MKKVAEHFNLGVLLSAEDAGGFANRNLCIETRSGKFLARILGEHGPDLLETEIRYLELIAANDFPCPAYLVGRDGGFALSVEGQCVAVMRFLQGRQTKEPTSEQNKSIAIHLARLHMIDGTTLPQRETWWHPDFLRSSLARAKEKYGDIAMSGLVGELEVLAEFDVALLPTSIVHGDPWPGNILFNGENLAGLIDWEETCIGAPIFDLAYAVLHGCMLAGGLDRPKIDSFIASYESIRKLSTNERQVFALALRQVALINYLWLILKMDVDADELEQHWASQWYRGLDLKTVSLEP